MISDAQNNESVFGFLPTALALQLIQFIDKLILNDDKCFSCMLNNKLLLSNLREDCTYI